MDYYRQLKKLPPNFTVLIPFNGHKEDLKKELLLGNHLIVLENDKLIIIHGTLLNFIWAQDQWQNCQVAEFKTTHEASQFIKSWPVLSCYYPCEQNEFGKKISNLVRQLPLKRIKYKPSHEFNFKFYVWTAIENLVIYSSSTKSRFPFGWHEFEEDKSIPPNRAYLKLWEVFSVYKIHPGKNDTALEIGASPGGWSWVLSQLCQNVETIDRAPLDQKVMKFGNIKHREGDAFKLNPIDFKNCTWFFSDIICTPEKLYETVQFWIKNSTIKNYVCTIKFKGDCDFDIIKKFLNIPSSQIVHLYHNKNEVTWIKFNDKL